MPETETVWLWERGSGHAEAFAVVTEYETLLRFRIYDGEGNACDCLLDEKQSLELAAAIQGHWLAAQQGG